MRGHHLSFLVTSSQLRNRNTMIQPEVTPRPYLQIQSNNNHWALICYLHNPKIFFLEIPQGPLGISIGNIQSAQKAFRVPQSSVFCHFPCFSEISPKNGICSQSRIFWPIFKCHTILESYRQHGRRAILQVKIRGLNKEL